MKSSSDCRGLVRRLALAAAALALIANAPSLRAQGAPGSASRPRTVALASYLGSAADERVVSTQTDSAGNIYVFGRTMDASTFPAGVAIGTPYPAAPKCFVSKLDASASHLLYSAVLADSYPVNQDALCDAMWVTPDGRVAVLYTGNTLGTFTKTIRTFQSQGTSLAPVAVIRAVHLEGLLPARAIDLDAANDVYVLGSCFNSRVQTPPPSFATGFRSSPTTPTHCRTTDNGAGTGASESVIAKYDATGHTLYASYLGGSADDDTAAVALTVDDNGIAYVAGRTLSADFPVSSSAMQTTCVCPDAFFMALDTTRSGSASLPYSSYLGGSGDDTATAIHVDSAGVLKIAGATRSPDFAGRQGLTDSTFVATVDRLQGVLGQFVQLTTFPYGIDSAFSRAAGQFAFFADGTVAITGLTQDPGFPLVNEIYPNPAPGAVAPFISLFAADGTMTSSSVLAVPDSGFPHVAAVGVDGLLLGMDTAAPDLAPTSAFQLEPGGGRDVFVIGLVQPNDPPLVDIGSYGPVVPTSPAGAPVILRGTVSDPDGDTVSVTWSAGSSLVTYDLSPPFFATNAGVSLQLPIGTSQVTLTVNDHHGHVVSQSTNVQVDATNTAMGIDVDVTPVDGRMAAGNGSFPGRMTVHFDTVTASGLTFFLTRTNQLPPPSAGLQPGSPPYYYDVSTTAQGSGNVRLCFDTTGMSFVAPVVRVFSLTGTTWADVTSQATASESAGRLLCAAVPFNANLGTFALFTAADETARVTTIVGNGQPFALGNPAPGDNGPATDAAVGPFEGIAIDRANRLLYVADNVRVRRVDLSTNIITTIAGTGAYPDSAATTLGGDARLAAINPNGLAVDRAGNLFLGDINGCGILRVDRVQNTITRVAGKGPDPATFSCAHSGDGGLAVQADVNDADRFVFDAAGNLFFNEIVSGTNGFSIRRIAAGDDGLITGDDPKEIVTTVAGGSAWPPAGGSPHDALLDVFDMVFNDQGDMYVAMGGLVARITPAPGAHLIDGSAGEAITSVSGGGILNNAPFQGDGGPAISAGWLFASGLAILPGGDVVVADAGFNRLRRISAGADGVVNGGDDETIGTVAGFSDAPQPAFNGDGYALSTTFSSPRKVIVDPRGGLDVTDPGLNRVRHIGVAFAGGQNHAPIANAGPDQTIVLAGSSVTAHLDGSASLDPDGDPLTFEWREVGAVVGRSATLQLPEGLGVHTFTLTVTDTVGASSSDDVVVSVTARADVSVAVTPSSSPIYAGATLTYTITVTNNGPSDATGVSLTMPVSSAFSVAGVHSSPGICVSPIFGGLNPVNCDLGSIASGHSVVMSIDIVPKIPGLLETSFAVAAAQLDSNQANNSARSDVQVVSSADLAVAVAGPIDGSTVPAGAPVTYDVTVSNLGPSSSSAGARLRWSLPASLTLVSAAMPGATCSVGAGAVFCDIAPLAAGGQLQATMVARADVLGSVTTTFDVSGIDHDPNAANNLVSTTVIADLILGETIHVTDTMRDADVTLVETIFVNDTLVDRDPPVVTPPSSITVAATEGGGARGNVSLALQNFLSGGSAVDAIDRSPARLTPTAVINGTVVDATGDRLFPADATTTVTFGYRDAAGNTGIATANVTVQRATGGLIDVGGLPVQATDLSGNPVPVTTTFFDLLQPGLVTGTAMPIAPAFPSGFVALTPVYDIVTSALYRPTILVCLLGSGFAPGDQLRHFEGSVWVDITTSATATAICGSASSLSPFVVLRSANHPPTASASAPATVEASSAAGAAVTLLGSGSDPDAGDTLSFRWTEGSATLGTSASITVTRPLGSHDITLTVTDSHGASATVALRVVVVDSKAPITAAPSAITIPATEAGGVRASAWPALAAFLAGGSATDGVDGAPARLAPQVNRVDVDNATLFAVGKTTVVAFRFRDASGNVGTASSSVTVVLGAPRIAVQIAGHGSASEHRQFVDSTFTNVGTGLALRATSLLALLTPRGSGVVRLLSPGQPIGVGNLDPGQSRVVRIVLDVPATVREIALVEAGAFFNVKGAPAVFADLQTYTP